MIDEITLPPTKTGDRSNCSESHSAVNVTGSALVLGLLVAVSVIAAAIAFYATAKAEHAVSEAQSARREARLLEQDVNWLRAFLAGRGIKLPTDHEEADSPK